MLLITLYLTTFYQCCMLFIKYNVMFVLKMQQIERNSFLMNSQFFLQTSKSVLGEEVHI